MAADDRLAPLATALSTIYARVPLGMRLGLDAMRSACAKHNNPQDAYPVVHVAGTNGKGSTCAMVESMARASGLRTGLYTSPHLCRFSERIRIDGAPLTDDDLAEHLAVALDPALDLSFFEAATFAAFLAFRAHAVDLAIVEVGIGGRLDATNVVSRPRCSVITSIALDHQDRLGPTLAAIAREKAGIIRPGVPLVLGALPAEARTAIATFKPSPWLDAPPANTHECADLPLYQQANASVALTIADVLNFSDEAKRVGLTNFRWPGRFERIRGVGELEGNYLLDGAHNPAGTEALVASLTERGEPPTAMVFGAMEDKDWRAMLDVLVRLPAARFYVAPRGRAPANAYALSAHQPGAVCASVREALTSALGAAGQGTVLVCGSLYLVGEARALLIGLPSDPPVAL